MDEKEIAELKNEVKTAFLDEIMAAINTGLIDVDDVADVLRNKIKYLNLLIMYLIMCVKSILLREE